MRKFILYSIPVLTLALFALFMNAGPVLKKPVGEQDNVEKYLVMLQQDIENGNWEKAAESRNKLEEAWQEVIPRIQYTLERDEIRNLNVKLARLKGLVEARDRAVALAELSELRMYWDKLGE